MTYTRNAEGIITDGISIEITEIDIHDTEVPVTVTTTGSFDSQGNIIYSEANYVNEDGVTVREDKAEYTYDSSQRLTHFISWIKDNGDWEVQEEEKYAYDNQGREILNEYRYKEGKDYWYGSRNVIEYDGDLQKRTHYYVDSETGEFNTTPSMFTVDGVLPDGTQQTIYQDFDADGTILSGHRNERQTEGNKETYADWEWDRDTQSWYGQYKSVRDETPVQLSIPQDPTDYNDGIEPAYIDGSTEFTLDESYTWENGDWELSSKRAYEKQSNGDISFILWEPNYQETIVYSFDAEGKLVKITLNDTDTKVYTYNADGMVETMNDNGILSTYYYSKRPYLPLDIDEIQEHDPSITMDGRTVTAADPQTVLRVYTVSGILTGMDTGSITIPESGIFIVTTKTKTLKVLIR